MTHCDVELLAIGAGPANLALAVAVEELAPAELAESSLLVEKAESISWQRGMLLPEAQSQVSFLKDVVSLRNPCSRFSFVNYLHTNGRLSDYVNMGNFWPYRVEMSDYFQWVANSLATVRLECSRQCTRIEPRRGADGAVERWITHLADGTTIGSRYLVIGAGRDRYIPSVFDSLPARRLIHSTEYLERIGTVPKDVPHRVVVIGGAQSAAEMFDAVQRDLPGCHRTLVMRSIGMKTYENSKFTNELYFPGFVDEFYSASAEAREQILREMHVTNYSALAESTLESVYRQLYLDRMSGKGQLRVITMADVTAAREDSDEVVLTLVDRKTGGIEELRCDLLLLGTGFRREMPSLVRNLGDELGLDRIEVNRSYRLLLDGPATAACYLQGVNEATHGIADSLLSILAPRAADIVHDILAHRGSESPAPVPQSSNELLASASVNN
jgi:L-ornithine N5-oxygenase